MKNTVEYGLIEISHKIRAKALDIFENNVTRSMEEGWRPAGGVFITYDKQDAWTYSQAMVKELGDALDVARDRPS